MKIKCPVSKLEDAESDILIEYNIFEVIQKAQEDHNITLNFSHELEQIIKKYYGFDIVDYSEYEIEIIDCYFDDDIDYPVIELEIKNLDISIDLFIENEIEYIECMVICIVDSKDDEYETCGLILMSDDVVYEKYRLGQ